MNSIKGTSLSWLAVAALTFLGLNPFIDATAGIQHFELGSETSHFDYQEPEIGVKDTGIFYGVYGAYTLQAARQVPVRSLKGLFDHIPDNGMLRLDGHANYGKVHYSSDDSGSDHGIPDYIVEVRLAGGYTFQLWGSTSITPYFGVGYRYLNDDSSGHRTSTGYYGYERESNYVYVPLGFQTKSVLKGKWTWGFTTEYDFLIRGKQITHLDDVASYYNSLRSNQHSGYGIRGSVEFIYHTGPLGLVIEPFVRYWNIKKSDTSTVTCYGMTCGYGYEPRNHTVVYGMRLGAAF